MRKTACVLYIQLIICISLKILTGFMRWQIWNWCISRFIFFCNAHLSIIHLWFGYPKFSGEQVHLQKKETAEITKTTKKLCSNCPPFFWYESLSLVFVTSFYIIVAFQIPRSHLLALYENQPLITLKLFT